MKRGHSRQSLILSKIQLGSIKRLKVSQINRKRRKLILSGAITP